MNPSLQDEIFEIMERLKVLSEIHAFKKSDVLINDFSMTDQDYDKIILAAVHDEYKSRRDRNRFFGNDLFSEPAWDILLDLYMQHEKGKSVSVTSACLASGVPSTTALRWLRVLEEQELILRTAHPMDHRSYVVKITESGHRRVRLCILERLQAQSFVNIALSIAGMFRGEASG